MEGGGGVGEGKRGVVTEGGSRASDHKAFVADFSKDGMVGSDEYLKRCVEVADAWEGGCELAGCVSGEPKI